MKHPTHWAGGLAVALATAPLWPAVAQTEQTSQAAPAAEAPAAPAGFWDSFTFGAEVEAGITANPTRSSSGVNFGHLFTDRTDQVLLNQLSLTAARPVDPKATGFDWGFKLEGLYGTDARYTHFLGELTHVTSDRTQLDVIEASLSAHLPFLTEGGIDMKFGQFPTPIGFEVIEPTGNAFYSHSYIFNFGIPLKHTGGYMTAHLNDTFDLWLGGDTGVNTSVGSGDNNKEPAFIGGFGLNNLMGGALTILALTHIGPENAYTVDPSQKLRYLNDVIATYKATDTLTLTTEANYIQDDFAHAQGWGITQYVSYAVSDHFAVNFRGEVWRDNEGFFVAAFPHNLDFVDAEEGIPNNSFNFGRATYSEFTLGATFKPDVPDMFSGLMIRPEVRYDRSLTGKDVFAEGTDNEAFTASIDIVIPIAIVAPPAAATPAPTPPPAAAAPPPPPPARTPEAQRSFQVFFDFDKSNITAAAARVIQAAADTVKSGGYARITVTGHTDTVGTAAYNQALSERRAAAVKRQLVADGVSGGEVTTRGVGKSGLLVPTADGVREPQNRRAEIVLQ